MKPIEAMAAFFKSLNIPQAEWEDPTLDVSATPIRVARMYQDELLASYKPGAYDDLVSRFTTFPNERADAPLVTQGPFTFTSVCSHHMVAFSGEAYIGYLPGDFIIGASKPARVLEHFSRKLQIQERLGEQIADFLYEKAKARWVGVTLVALHGCMHARGVRQLSSRMVTTSLRPIDGPSDFRHVTEEFYTQCSFLKR